MKKLFAILVIPLFLLPYTGIAAIAFDAATNGSGASTFSHTTTGNNRILFVGISGSVGSDTITGVTYNSVSMSLVNKVLVPSDRYVYLFMLTNPASGANDVVISGTGLNSSAASSYTGAKQSGQPDAQAIATSTAVNPHSNSVTTIADNSWAVIMLKSRINDPSPWGQTTARVDVPNFILGDNNSAITPAGSITLQATSTLGLDDFGSVMASFAPATDEIIAPIKSIKGIGVSR